MFACYDWGRLNVKYNGELFTTNIIDVIENLNKIQKEKKLRYNI